MAQVACLLLHYQYPEYVLACLQSLKDSGADEFKIFMVNNSVYDGSGPSLKKYLEESGMAYRYLEMPGNIGYGGGMNQGVRAALEEKIPHLLLLNNDITVPKDFTREVLQAIRNFPDGVIAGRILDADTGEPTFNLGKFSPLTGRVLHTFDQDSGGPIDFVDTALAVVPSSVLARVGPYEEGYFVYCEDVDLFWRIKDLGVPIRYVPTLVVYHKTSSTMKRSGAPKVYYLVRNQTHLVMKRAKPRQRFFYLIYLVAMLGKKLAFHPALFPQALHGAIDGLRGKLGKRHLDAIP